MENPLNISQLACQDDCFIGTDLESPHLHTPDSAVFLLYQIAYLDPIFHLVEEIPEHILESDEIEPSAHQLELDFLPHCLLPTKYLQYAFPPKGAFIFRQSLGQFIIKRLKEACYNYNQNNKDGFAVDCSETECTG